MTTLCLDGARAVEVDLELQYTGGLMQRVIMTGLPGGAVRESRDRIRGCLDHCRLPVPRRSVLANFAPADVAKQGNGFDLPLAVGLLTLTGVVPPGALSGRVVLGEIALDGRLRPVRGGLALALAARRAGHRAILLPRENGPEAALVQGLRVEAVGSLPEALEVLAGAPPPEVTPVPRRAPPTRDLADVRGQASARRALEIAAAGRHNLLLVGPPGTGKTMLAQRLPGLLPPLDEELALEVTALHGLVASGPATVHGHAPFRAPHHTVSRAGLIGGGTPLMPGEVCLAHGGVLFLDELPEFSRALLETLRQPLEDGEVRLARAGRRATFPADFQLVGAMNPCACGYRGHPTRMCSCAPHQVEQYRRRLSGPLLDRFDLCVEMPPPEGADWMRRSVGESSACVAARVAAARRRLGSAAAPSEAAPPEAAGSRPRPRPFQDARVRRRLEAAVRAYSLSGRAVRKLEAVAGTVAALDGRREPGVDDLDEALSFRVGLMSEP